ncbi:MAG: hypothetical protein J0H06_11780 [Actinobacteria bacterium]|nr:hypothetical protein [Actinomycetota bacterium]
MGTFFHVTPSENRESILRHGLDWRRGGGGIAGSTAPEQEGTFLACEQTEVDFFVHIGKHRFAALDIWAVTLDDLDPAEFELSDEPSDERIREFDGFLCWMEIIPPTRLRLVARDV